MALYLHGRERERGVLRWSSLLLHERARASSKPKGAFDTHTHTHTHKRRKADRRYVSAAVAHLIWLVSRATRHAKQISSSSSSLRARCIMHGALAYIHQADLYSTACAAHFPVNTLAAGAPQPMSVYKTLFIHALHNGRGEWSLSVVCRVCDGGGS
jgi:hypothetical protein